MTFLETPLRLTGVSKAHGKVKAELPRENGGFAASF